MTTAPGPGWYVDPEDSQQMRWWSGETWTEHRSPHPNSSQAPSPATVDIKEAPYIPMGQRYAGGISSEDQKLTHREKDRQIRKNNSLAYTGCVLSLVAFLINPFAILSILGIVFSAIGLAKSHDLDGRHRVTGRGTAIAGIVVGIIGLAAFAWALAQRMQAIA